MHQAHTDRAPASPTLAAPPRIHGRKRQEDKPCASQGLMPDGSRDFVPWMVGAGGRGQQLEIGGA
jgi:hypothetical protein